MILTSEQAKAWSRKNPKGKEVHYQSVMGCSTLERCRIQSWGSWELSPGSWVVKVSGQSGGVSIEHIFDIIELTKNQITVGAHTIGLDRDKKRNYFCAGSKGQDREDLDILEGYGYAISIDIPVFSGDDRVFHLTELGIHAITEAFKARTK